MFTTGWAAPRRRSACQTADVLALKSHNLDATTFWFRAPNFGDPAQRHRQFCASSSPTEGTRAGRCWSTRSWSITYFILCSSSRDSAPSFDPASSGNGHVESLGRAIDDQMERASIRAACAFSDGDQLSMSSIGGWLSPRAPRNRTRRGTNIVAEVQSPKTRSRRCCETMIFVLSSFIRLSEPTSRGTVTGQRTSRTRLRVYFTGTFISYLSPTLEVKCLCGARACVVIEKLKASA